jgi:hypothetical protein
MYRKIGSVASVAFALVLAAPAVAAVAASDTFTIDISRTVVTVPAGGQGSTVIRFTEPPKLEDTRVDLSVTGLPAGVTANFFPPKPCLCGSSILALQTSASTPVGATMLTVTAVTRSTGPITVSAPLTLSVTG